MQAEVFVPGHITGFFEIHLDDPDLLRCGSRGAGFCIEKGVRTKVEIRDADGPAVTVRFNGEPVSTASTTGRVVELMLGSDHMYEVTVDSTFDLPVSQGLGVSGAGALGTAVAVDSALELGNALDVLVAYAHRAEVECRTGLGDVIAQSRGGLEMRTAPGAPPFGSIRVQRWDADVLIVVFDPPLATSRVLADTKKRDAVNAIGSGLLDVFSADMTPRRFQRLSREFTIRAGLASSSIMNALKKVPGDRIAAMAMLGNTIFLAGDDVHDLADIIGSGGACILTHTCNESIRDMTR